MNPLCRPDGTPLPPDHHLEFRKDRGDYRAKITIHNPEGKHLMGKRILIPLSTSDLSTARMMRDIVLLTLERAGQLSRPILGDDSSP